jgi:hypothetical protein
MSRRLTAVPILVSLTLAGCIVPKGTQPQVDLGMDAASAFVHRGMTLVNRPVLQPHMDVALDASTGGQLGFTVSGNIDLYDNTGSAWFPDGHAGRFTQIEMVADYQHQLGWLTLKGGIHSYNLPNGQEFTNGERGGTNEVFLLASGDVLETTPYVSVHYDFDEVNDVYARAGLSEDFDLGAGWKLDLDGSLGYAGRDQAAWMYGLQQSGWADLRGSALVNYEWDDRTTLQLGLHGSTIVDKGLDAWFDAIGIDSDVLWVSLGVNWHF